MSTLNWIGDPAFTLIWVANPWMVGSPTPSMSHSLAGIPGQLVLADDGVAGAGGLRLQRGSCHQQGTDEREEDGEHQPAPSGRHGQTCGPGLTIMHVTNSP